MFTTLLEARAGRSRPRGGAVVSLCAHVAAVTLAVVATQQDVGANQDPPPTETVTPVYTPDPPPGPPVAAPAPAAPVVDALPTPPLQLIVVAPVEIPNVLPEINAASPVTPDFDRTVRLPARNGTPTSTARSGAGISSDGVFTPSQVDKPAIQIAGVGVPVYPEVLKEAGFGGQVLVAFVIDTTGRAEVKTLRVLRSTRPEFARAVTDALPRMRFLPAQAGGRNVRQLVELPFHFNVLNVR